MNKLISILKANFNDIIKPVIVLLTICIVIPLALSVTNKVTEKRIEDLIIKNQNDTMLKLIDADTFFKETFSDDNESFEFQKAKKKGETVGYIFLTSAKGYGGTVTVMTAIGTDGRIIDIAITEAPDETPGLGQNVTKETFYSQYKDKTSGVQVVKGGNGGENTVDAVTGATISSRAVNTAVTKALENFSAYSNAEFIDTEVTASEKQ